MIKFNQQLWFSLGASLFFTLIWAIPLKSLIKFLVFKVGVIMEEDSYSVIGLCLFLIILYGIITFVITKSIQYLKNEGDNIQFKEFFKIFMVSIATTIFIFLIGYPFLFWVGMISPIMLDSVPGDDNISSHQSIVVEGGRSNIEIARLRGQIEEKITQNNSMLDNDMFGFKQRFLHLNIARLIDLRGEIVDMTAGVNFSQDHMKFIVEGSREKAVILTQEHVQANAINGHRLVVNSKSSPYQTFQAGDLVRKIHRQGEKRGIIEYEPVVRNFKDLIRIYDWSEATRS